MLPEILAFLKHHYIFDIVAAQALYFCIVATIVGIRRYEVHTKMYEMERERLTLVQEIAKRQSRAELAQALSTMTPENWETVKDIGMNILLPFIPTSVLESTSIKKAHLANIKVSGAAAKAGLTAEHYIPIRQKELINKIEIDHEREQTQAAIRAGLEVNAEVHRRKQQISEQIEELEQQLETTTSKIVKDGIKRTIKTLKDEYDELGRPSV